MGKRAPAVCYRWLRADMFSHENTSLFYKMTIFRIKNESYEQLSRRVWFCQELSVMDWACLGRSRTSQTEAATGETKGEIAGKVLEKSNYSVSSQKSSLPKKGSVLP